MIFCLAPFLGPQGFWEPFLRAWHHWGLASRLPGSLRFWPVIFGLDDFWVPKKVPKQKLEFPPNKSGHAALHNSWHARQLCPAIFWGWPSFLGGSNSASPPMEHPMMPRFWTNPRWLRGRMCQVPPGPLHNEKGTWPLYMLRPQV